MADSHVGELFSLLADLHNGTIALPQAEVRFAWLIPRWTNCGG